MTRSCLQCGALFGSEKELREHFRVPHKLEFPAVADLTTTCSRCGATGPASQYLEHSATCALFVPPARDPWKHRSTGMRCATCMWYVAKERVTEELVPEAPPDHERRVSALLYKQVTVPATIGRCRRHAPGASGTPGWPQVYETDWCGDHRIDENKR